MTHNGIAIPDAARELARCDLIAERERRHIERTYTPMTPEREAAFTAGVDRLQAAESAVSRRDEVLGQLTRLLMMSRCWLDELGEADKLATVQAWVDELMPQKWQAERDWEAARGEMIRFLNGGE